MIDAWNARIDRAARLAGQDESARALLISYGRMLEAQRDCAIAMAVAGNRLTGSFERDLVILRPAIDAMLRHVASGGPPALAGRAQEMLGAPDDTELELRRGWHQRAGHTFFQKLVLQPYAGSLARGGVPLLDRNLDPQPRTCPFCGGLPQLAVLRSAADEDGAGRHLLCAICSTPWRTGRISCARCGEENERRLAYYEATAFTHVRVDACDSCRHYLKTVDLTRLGIAEPVVDEVAAAPLDVWAGENGYQKIELNLIGL